MPKIMVRQKRIATPLSNTWAQHYGCQSIARSIGLSVRKSTQETMWKCERWIVYKVCWCLRKLYQMSAQLRHWVPGSDSNWGLLCCLSSFQLSGNSRDGGARDPCELVHACAASQYQLYGLWWSEPKAQLHYEVSIKALKQKGDPSSLIAIAHKKACHIDREASQIHLEDNFEGKRSYCCIW